jgi:succinyl-CoA synthetase beta subunit
MNQLIQHKSWIKRNRKWFIPSIGLFVVVLVIFLSSGLGGKVADIGKAYADTTLYKDAIKEVKKNREAINTLGDIKPIDKMAITEGFVEYSEDNKKVKTTIRLKGTKGQGKLDILAERNKNSWIYKEIKIRVRGSEKPIIIIEKK